MRRPSSTGTVSAQKLARNLIPYLLDAHVQAFTPSPFFRKIEPSPTESGGAAAKDKAAPKLDEDDITSELTGTTVKRMGKVVVDPEQPNMVDEAPESTKILMVRALESASTIGVPVPDDTTPVCSALKISAVSIATP